MGTSTRRAVMTALAAGSVAAQTAFYVGPRGDDTNPGTREQPLATLERARDAVRVRKTERGPAGEITVWVGGGVYELSAPFELDSRDSGTTAAPVVYSAIEGERPRVSGGRRVPGEAFRPVTAPETLRRLSEPARDKVLVCDLRALGIEGFGEMNRGALNGGAMLELFLNGQALPMARWPNGREWSTYGKVVDAGSRPRWQEKPERPGTLEYTGDRPARWVNAPEIWLHGYWAFDWYDDVLKVAELDTEQRRITFTTPHMYGLKSSRRFAALNLLEELDAPGEWVLERASGLLYLCPPAPMGEAQVVLSMLEQPLLGLTRTQHLTVRGLTFEFGRGKAVEILGGTDNLLVGCTIRNMGTGAVSIGPAQAKSEGHLRVESGDELVDGRRNGVAGCDIYNVGTGGISLDGGCRRGLAPGGHFAENNDIHHYSRRKRTGCPAIGLNGVGNRAVRNHVHDAPHTGLWYSGNDHLIELNEFARLCWETGDVGVIYSGRDWTFRGNVVRHNFIHHTIAPGQVGSMGVYLDDSHSSTHVYGNVFYKNDYAAFIGGGHHNVIENNIFVDCRKSVHLDNRSRGWAHKYQTRGGDHRMYGKLEDVRHDQPPYSTRYPELARILDGDPHTPTGNRAVRNVCVRGGFLHTYPGADEVFEVRDNLVTQDDPGFVDAGSMDFALRTDSRVYTEIPDFKPIPFADIGLRVDQYRLNLPPRAPRISPDGGAFAQSVMVTLSNARTGYRIRYTLDGSEPRAASQLYAGPLALRKNTVLKARSSSVDDEAALPSPTSEATFTLVEFGEGKGLYLSDLGPMKQFVHGGLKRDTNYRGNGFITLSGTVHRKGLLMHPESRAGGSEAYAIYELRPPLDKARAFRATVGVDDAGDERGSVRFKVELRRAGEWEAVFESPELHGRPKEEQVEVNVSLSGADALRLSVDGGSDISADHAAWAGARLE